MNRFLVLFFVASALLLLPGSAAHGQRNAIFYDSLGQRTSFELHWAQVVTGRWKSAYDRKAKTRTLTRTTPAEAATEQAKTAKRITQTEDLGSAFPAFDLADLTGHAWSEKALLDHVTVVNFWFVGCGPCEMERPELNALVADYRSNRRVQFLSFARTDTTTLMKFLAEFPFSFSVIPTDKTYLEAQFGVARFPVTLVIGPDGTKRFNAQGSGVGIRQIIHHEIDRLLAP